MNNVVPLLPLSRTVRIPDHLFSIEQIVDEEAKRAVAEANKLISDHVRAEIREQHAEASGDFLKSIAETLFEDEQGTITGIVFSTAPYAQYIEEGRQPGRPYSSLKTHQVLWTGMPPKEAILAWMAFKGMQLDDTVAFLIARKIARDGIPGQHFFQHAVDETADAVQQLFETAAHRIAQRLASSE